MRPNAVQPLFPVSCCSIIKFAGNDYSDGRPHNDFRYPADRRYNDNRYATDRCVLRSCFAHHNTLVSALEALRNALYKCSTYLLTYLLVLLHDTALCTVALVLRSVVMLRCAPRYSCSVEDLLWCSSVRATVELCVRKRVTADQVRTAGLVQECTATHKYVCLTRSLLVTSRTLRVTEMITVGLLQIKNFLIVKLTIING